MAKLKVDLNVRDNMNLNSFWLAAYAGQPSVIRVLCLTTIDKTLVNQSGCNALHIATKLGHSEVVQSLAESGFPLDETNNKGVTALGIASQKGNIKILQLLVNSGADLHKGVSPISLAIKFDQLEAVEYLLQNGGQGYYSEISKRESSPIFFALRAGKEQALLLLLNYTSDLQKVVDSANQSILFHVIELASQSTIRTVVEKMRNLDIEDH